ncbi:MULTISPECIES: ABC transporter permease [Flavobacterium]|jgi:cell division transport system permease protein|uniref:cell division protein FtsX n=1 Tax=Flavobacterium TaxID=237 RepID=UPI0006F576D1|nr:MULTISPECIES: permease-like cell division protein FtsX [Flavobacterium]MBU7570909.1 permease-like cell division protein FtsX [Flavobacterium sp.]THD33181.1 MAG: FtsX-like permease family protein [Flavobacterium johnsoniae]KQS46457.1 cell division protein FtsX [Flavobacterium sp. Leaf359]MBL7868329.1 FtsX-like permease family protein [Flavobacterium lindanitolerans]MDQ7959263.1 permease-like cell division protein FtsX [Flavobacterium lindanitolerans]
MASSFEKFQKRRLISSYFSVVLSVFLVLFLLGILGLFVINSKKLSDDFKEEIAMSVYFKNEANDSIINAFDTQLKTSKFVKSYEFVTKEKAAKQHTDIIGEDFMAFLGENPLENSFDIHLKADYIVADSIKKFESTIVTNPMVSDIVYDKVLVNLVNDNIQRISFWILIASGFLALVAVLLINSSMRLSIYSNRFIIKTMQMVGATKSFIRKPFIWRSIKLGIIGSLLAIFALIGVLYYVDTNFPNLKIMEDQLMVGLVLVGVLIVGILITWFSTFFATQRFLNLRTDDLY